MQSNLQRPQLVIVALAGSFAFLLSILLTSIFWNIQHAITKNNIWILVTMFSTVSQIVCRLIFIYAYRMTERIIKQSSPDSAEIFPLNDISSSIASGVGFGAMHSLMMFGSVLAASNGSGDLFVDSCPDIPLILSTSLIALAFSALDCVLMCMMFMAEKLQYSKTIIVLACLLHFTASCSTLANTNEHGCLVSLPLVYTVVAVSICLLIWMWPLIARGATRFMPTFLNFRLHKTTEYLVILPNIVCKHYNMLKLLNYFGSYDKTCFHLIYDVGHICGHLVRGKLNVPEVSEVIAKRSDNERKIQPKLCTSIASHEVLSNATRNRIDYIM
eukprot:gene6957-14124_t